MMELGDWLGEYSGPGYMWYVKRLSGNDTLANKTHQAGPYIPKELLFEIFPSLARVDIERPDIWFDVYIDSHADARRIRAVYYNSKRFKKQPNGRDETRLTNWGGSESALLDPESTGALTIFAFSRDSARPECHVWVCRHETEEDLVEDRLGPVEPGKTITQAVGGTVQAGLMTAPTRASCWLTPAEIPPAWLTKFPSGAEIIAKAAELQSHGNLMPDFRLMKRRGCEYEIFRSVEEAIELPVIKAGFSDINGFIARAQTILQRRKSRAGRSLELHAREIFTEEKLVEGTDFSHQPESEAGKSPDFLFPSETAYKDPQFPRDRLRMLAVKTTMKDRWRQILNEANRVEQKHLLTLQEGLSEAQFREMVDAKVTLVVPKPIMEKFPASVQPYLQTLESFIGDVRLLRI
ncbi:type II restriction endonuclease [Agrobacterium cavarae]|uniref:type II restriction endonuclease n=1 Tax=Agrobacterium cavarae TaxID=2528239 RepID=UPI0028B216D5|nr:type II restriction endonuclease [Agrobacterium cavarae]